MFYCFLFLVPTSKMVERGHAQNAIDNAINDAVDPKSCNICRQTSKMAEKLDFYFCWFFFFFFFFFDYFHFVVLLFTLSLSSSSSAMFLPSCVSFDWRPSIITDLMRFDRWMIQLSLNDAAVSINQYYSIVIYLNWTISSHLSPDNMFIKLSYHCIVMVAQWIV